jgi:hypothetical protein
MPQKVYVTEQVNGQVKHLPDCHYLLSSRLCAYPDDGKNGFAGYGALLELIQTL